MEKFKRATDSVLSFLHNNYRPFKDLMVVTLLRSSKTLRTINMRKGEEFHLRGNEIPDYLFVIQGRVETTKGDNVETIDAIDNLGSLHLFPANNKLMHIKALSDSTIVQADTEMLTELTTWDTLARDSGLFETKEEEAGLERIRVTKAFRKLPMEAVEEVFKRLKRIDVCKGDEIVKQGDVGDAFYLLITGNAEVWRQGLYDEEQQLVSILTSGDAFGEEALIIKGTRNATVRMQSDGVLFKLGQADFDELIATPMIKIVPPQVANTMLENGYNLLDVRYEEEYDESYIPGAQLVPLPDLRERINEIDPKKKYLVVCAVGKRASVGALLMRQYNIKDLSVIEGGMRDWPYETQSNY